MAKNNRGLAESGKFLATDLDGTLIPLQGNRQNRRDLEILKNAIDENRIGLIFVTGRHLESVRQAMEHFELPVPDWIICDVGTSIYQAISPLENGRRERGDFEPLSGYHSDLQQTTGSHPVEVLRRQLVPLAGMRLQEREKQGRFKLSYYADAVALDVTVAGIREQLAERQSPWSVIASVDPFNGDGLIDLVPAGCSKAHALDWLARHLAGDREKVVFAGDSGNDLAAMTAGYPAIIVANANRPLARRVCEEHKKRGWKNRLFLASQFATSGVLEGCRWFDLFRTPPHESDDEYHGSYPTSCNSAVFRVWAPGHKSVEVILERPGSDLLNPSGEPPEPSSGIPLIRDPQGCFSVRVQGVAPDAKYRFVPDHGDALPDPASNYQPEGVHGFSQLVDHAAFAWTDQDWRGAALRDLVIYELHVGTYTADGTFVAAIERLEELVELGVTAIELMPVAQTSGRWNWGYDGVNLYAVRNSYGTPDDFKALVDACHAKGISVILDVVYNHIGPEGNYLDRFGPYFSRKHHTPWGNAFAFDGPDARQVRQFITDNALYWLKHFHLDGLRLDAVHFMFDDSQPDILREIPAAVSRLEATSGRKIHLFAETNVFDSELLASGQPTGSSSTGSESGERSGFDAIWCDCLMHSIYSHAGKDFQFAGREYRGMEDIMLALQRGYVYGGHPHERIAGGAARHPDRNYLASLVVALQNHDAIGNHPAGNRLHQLTSARFQMAAAALILLHPGIPLMFMGEESASDSPFPFFMDFENESLVRSIEKNRKRELKDRLKLGFVRPSGRETFESAICPASARNEVWHWYRQLIQIRKQGLSGGWLRPERFRVGFDSGRQLILIRYTDSDESGLAEWQVYVRLTPGDSSALQPIRLDLENATLIASSQPLAAAAREIALHPNHTIVLRRDD